MTSVLVVCGPIGVGKTTIVQAADRMLLNAHVSHATIILEGIAGCWPVPDEPQEERVAHLTHNLASLWSDYVSRGAERLLVEMLVEHRSDLRPVGEAIPDAEITLVRLRAPLELIEERVRHREPDPEDELTGARWWHEHYESIGDELVEDAVIDNDQRSPEAVAGQVLRVAGWLAP